ncbi:MAG: hypothetical protein ACXVCY_04590 [Pseudobdellovibrionaceae bacterium]
MAISLLFLSGCKSTIKQFPDYPVKQKHFIFYDKVDQKYYCTRMELVDPRAVVWEEKETITFEECMVKFKANFVAYTLNEDTQYKRAYLNGKKMFEDAQQ